MPRIPRTERQVGLSITQQPYGNFGGEAVGQAVSKLGGAISDFGDVALQERNNLDDFNANMAYVDWKNGQDIRQQEYDTSITGDGRHHLTNRIATFDQDAAQFYSGLPDNPKIREKYAIRLQADRGDYGMRSYSVQQNHVQNWYADQGEKYVTQTVVPHIDGTPQSLDRGLTAIDQMIAGSPGIKPQIADKLRERAAKNIFDAWLDKSGPDAAVNAEELLKTYQGQPDPNKPMDGEILPPEPDPRQGTLNQGSPRIPQQGQPGSPSGPAAEKPQAQTPTLEIVPASMTRRVGRPRSAAVAGMVIHETQGSDTADGNFSWSNKKNTGANYYIDKSGKIIEWAPDNVVMNHAGKGRGVKGDVRPDLRNENTISVEIMTRPGEKPNQAQIEALHLLAGAKATEHGFTVDDIEAHGRLAPGWKDVEEGTSALAYLRDNWKGGPRMSTAVAEQQSKFAGQVADESGRVMPRTPMTARDAFFNLLTTKRDDIKRHALQLERKREAEEKTIQSLDEKAAHRQGLELLYGRKLSNDWIEANKSRLTNEHYGMFLRAVNPRPTMTDPQTHVDLLERADEDPDEVMQKAGEAYANRQISQTAFDQIYRKAQKAKSDETRLPGWVSEQRQLVKRKLRPPASASEDDLKDYTAALEQFDAYVDERHGDKAGQGPDGKGKTTLDRKELTDFAQKLVHEQKTKRVGNVRRNLSLPRYTQVARDALSLEELQQSIRRTADAYKAGKLSKSELAAEISNLKKWQDLLMSEGAATSRMDFAKGLRNTSGR